MGWIDIVGGAELDSYGAKVNRPRYMDEADTDYRIRLSQAQSPSDTRDYGGSAFPEPGSAQCGGMSLRDYFAAKAMHVIIESQLHDGGDVPEEKIPEFFAITAGYSYVAADAMLAERAK